MKDSCVIFANCQGGGIQKFLENHPPFSEKYNCYHVSNFEMIREAKPLPYELFNKTSLFIYQPVSTKHGQYSTKEITSHLHPSCIKISVPYIYNNALWPFFQEGEKIIGRETLDFLFANGSNLKQVINFFLELKLDFNFKSRFKQTLDILVRKETETNTKVSQFIIGNLPEKRLFYTQNHPTNDLFIYCVNQILALLAIRPLSPNRKFPDNFAQLPGIWPISPYDSAAFGYKFTTHDPGWENFYRRLIIKTYNKNGYSQFKELLNNLFLRICR